MKAIFVAVNAKYIHTNSAVRLLYKVVSPYYDACFKEFTIKDSNENIINELLNYDIVGFSTYIWNVEKIIEIATELKKRNKNIITFAGGPEVSYETPHFVKFFDYVMSGEGEEEIIPFFDYLTHKTDSIHDCIATKDKPLAIPAYVKDLNNVPDIFDLYTKEDRENKIIYVETSRGCPFSCSYCLSSLEKGVRFFSKERVDAIFDYINNNEFKCIKFLDRTFNVNPNRFIQICKALEKTNNTYQFEIAAELFNDDVINYLCNDVKKDTFRLEIGVQSLLDDAINEVGRIQDGKHLMKVIKRINECKRVTIHVDLIAGLPYENLTSFKNTFNETFKLLCDELQLGFLKMLRGTKLRKDADIYEYKFAFCSPYEVISNKYLSEDEMHIIKQCEIGLEWMWNDKRAKSLILHMIKDNLDINYFDFFADFSKYYDKKKPLDFNYKALINYLRRLDILNDSYIDDLKYDYLLRVRIRPQRLVEEYFNRNELFEHLMELDSSLNKNILSNAFICKYYSGYLLLIYKENKSYLLKVGVKNEE